MFTVLRRFSIFFTMIAEFFVLNVRPSFPIIVSVFLMIGGALIAAVFDLRFDLIGYIFIFSNNIFTALNGVWMKKATISGRCSKMGVLFYNSLFSALVMVLFFAIEHAYYSNLNRSNLTSEPLWSVSQLTRKLLSDSSGDTGFKASGDTSVIDALNKFLTTDAKVVIDTALTDGVLNGNSNMESPISKFMLAITFEGWSDWKFVGSFLLAAVMGSVLNYSIFLCTTTNSALTTSVIGCLKNVGTTYLGMFIFSDYHFSLLNFIGLNISIFGSLYYTYMTMVKGLQGYGGG